MVTPEDGFVTTPDRFPSAPCADPAARGPFLPEREAKRALAFQVQTGAAKEERP